MPDQIIDALFVLAGVMLTCQLAALLPGAKTPAARFALHAVMGLCTLLTANTLGRPFGMGIGLNALTLPVCAGLGAPGTALLWALRWWL